MPKNTKNAQKPPTTFNVVEQAREMRAKADEMERDAKRLRAAADALAPKRGRPKGYKVKKKEAPAETDAS